MKLEAKKLTDLNKQYSKLKKDEKIISLTEVNEMLDDIIEKQEELEELLSEQIDAIETFSGGSERVYVLTWYDQNRSNNSTSTKATNQSPYVTDTSGNILKNGDFVYMDDGSRNVIISPALIQPSGTSCSLIGIWDTSLASNRWNYTILGNAGTLEIVIISPPEKLAPLPTSEKS